MALQSIGRAGEASEKLRAALDLMEEMGIEREAEEIRTTLGAT
jgi:hypothetical protein